MLEPLAAVGAREVIDEALRHTARRFPTAVGLKAAGHEITGATFATRSEAVWGQGTTTVANQTQPLGLHAHTGLLGQLARSSLTAVLVRWVHMATGRSRRTR